MRILGVALVIACGVAGAAVIANGTAAAPAARVAPIPAAAWQPRPGDVILRASTDVVGSQIRGASGEGAIYSHTGLVVMHDGALAVVDVSPFGAGIVEFTSVEDFTTDGDTTDLLVLRPTASFDADKLARQASALATARVPFDSALDTEDKSALYCSELVYDLLTHAGLNLNGIRKVPTILPFGGSTQVIPPDAFAHLPGFARVYRRAAES